MADPEKVEIRKTITLVIYNFHESLCFILTWSLSHDDQRITISEIKKHPWFLKNLPEEFAEGEEASMQVNGGEDDYTSQSIEEALAIIQEARIPGEATKLNDLFVGGSMDLDEIDTDEDIDDSEISDDFVCSI